MKSAAFYWTVAALALVLGGSADAAFAAPERAMQIVREYSTALGARDYATAARLTHSLVVSRVGGTAKMEALLDTTWRDIEAAAGAMLPERLGTPTVPFVDGRVVAFSVPVLRSTATVSTPVVYLVTSYDAGETWAVLDLVCVDDGWIAAALPMFKGDPNELLPVHPDAASAAANSTVPRTQ